MCVYACDWCTTKSDKISIPPEQIIVALDISWATQKITISLMKDYTRGFLDSIPESLTNIYIEVVRQHTHDIPWICNIEYTFTYGNGWVVNCTFSCLNNKSNPFWYIVGHFLWAKLFYFGCTCVFVVVPFLRFYREMDTYLFLFIVCIVDGELHSFVSFSQIIIRTKQNTESHNLLFNIV